MDHLLYNRWSEFEKNLVSRSRKDGSSHKSEDEKTGTLGKIPPRL
jgi:hypothetical protein